MKRKLIMNYNFNSGITLISLVITIIILIILAGLTISIVIREDGVINKAQYAQEETLKQVATEKINLKITNTQINTYAKEQRMPTLQEIADNFNEDDEIEYVALTSKKVASVDKVDIGTSDSIFTKLKEYPYEFEINSSLQLASINGVKVATTGTGETTVGCNPKLLATITLPSTASSTRPVGQYYANTSSYTKANTENFDEYLSYNDENGWTVQKSGNYMISSYISSYNDTSNSKNCLIINSEDLLLNSIVLRGSNGQFEVDTNNTTIFLEKGTIINFYNKIDVGATKYHSASFTIYAMFK